MTDMILVSARKMIEVDVFLSDQDDIIGYQLGGETLKEFTTKPPFPSLPPEGTKATILVKVYGRIEYLLDSHTKQTAVTKYEAYDQGLKDEVEKELKGLESRGICPSYCAIVPTEDDSCNNCSYKVICP